MRPGIDDWAAFLAGFIAGEGCFSGHSNGNRFIFEVGLGAVDRMMCRALEDFLSVGHIYDSPRRKEHHDDQSAFMVQSLKDLVCTVIPFMDEHLPRSYQRAQYLDWHKRLLDYWEHKAKRVRPCTVEGCPRPRQPASNGTGGFQRGRSASGGAVSLSLVAVGSAIAHPFRPLAQGEARRVSNAQVVVDPAENQGDHDHLSVSKRAWPCAFSSE
ncbi:MAG: LAGLIDADG family homing endonuclease [Actinomycetota bacterium]